MKTKLAKQGKRAGKKIDRLKQIRQGFVFCPQVEGIDSLLVQLSILFEALAGALSALHLQRQVVGNALATCTVQPQRRREFFQAVADAVNSGTRLLTVSPPLLPWAPYQQARRRWESLLYLLHHHHFQLFDWLRQTLAPGNIQCWQESLRPEQQQLLADNCRVALDLLHESRRSLEDSPDHRRKWKRAVSSIGKEPPVPELNVTLAHVYSHLGSNQVDLWPKYAPKE